MKANFVERSFTVERVQVHLAHFARTSEGGIFGCEKISKRSSDPFLAACSFYELLKDEPTH